MLSGCRARPGRTARVALGAALALVGVVSAPTLAAAAPPPAAPVLGTGPLEPLVGSATPVPAGSEVLGGTDPSSRITVDVALRPRDPAALAGFVAAVSTPGDPRYHRYLPAGRLAAEFGPADGTLRVTREWLASAGLSVGTTSADGLLVPVSGTAAQVETAFSVPLVRARLADGRTVRLATRDPEAPSTLVPLLQGVIGLSDQALAHPDLTAAAPRAMPPPAAGSRAAVATAGPQACDTIAGPVGYAHTATELASTYGLSSLYGGGRTGAGQTIGLFELEGYAGADVAAYQACYGTRVPITDVPVDGGALAATNPAGEATLDIEVVAGLAPGASIQVYLGPNNGGSGPLDTYSRMVSDDTARVISTSWGQCEALMGATTQESVAAQEAEATVFALAASQGQHVLAAAGDSGSSDCYGADGAPGLSVDDPAAQPDVTGVGGTSLAAIAPGQPTESAWGGHGPSAGGGGGGNSATFAAPSWQQAESSTVGASTTCGGAVPGVLCRMVPDVSASADPSHGDWIYFRGNWYVFGGTSIAAPLWAALVADAVQGCSSAPGLLDPVLYGPGASSAFNDVTTGNNSLFGGANPPFGAGPGYDLATGWGSPRAAALLALLSGSASGCPTVTGVSPASGPARGGTVVTITGSGFGTGLPSVLIGGVPVTVRSATPTRITVVTPDVGTGRTGSVTVTTATGPSPGTSPAVVASQFTFVAPQVTSVSPYHGPPAGGGTVTIHGTGFAGASSVSFGGRSAPFTVTSSGSITATVPGGPAGGGTVDVVVTAAIGTSSPGPSDRYTYALPGYWLVASDGGIFAFGHAGFFGSAGDRDLGSPVVALAPTPDDRGYWMASASGAVVNFGDAGFLGSLDGHPLNRPIVGMAPTPDGGGYWLVASDGGIFAYGDAGFFGSTGNVTLNRPVVGMAPTLDGAGYWLVASDGGIFSYGDAGFHGSTGDLTLNQPIEGMATDLSGTGYWLVASDGGIFAFGSAPFDGSTGDLTLNRPITGMAAT